MAVFSSRSPGYKGGVVLLFFATVVFIVGFSAPYWLYVSVSSDLFTFVGFRGIWMSCESRSSGGSSETKCATYAWKDIADDFHAIRTLNSLCLIGLLASCIYALATNCCPAVAAPHNRVLEILASLSGLVGFVGCMVFLGTSTVDPHFAFYLAAIGSGLCVVAAFIISMNNTPTETITQADVNTLPMTTFPQGQSPGQGQPGAGGVFYGKTPAQPYGNAQSYGHYPQSYGDPQFQGYPQSYGYPAAM